MTWLWRVAAALAGLVAAYAWWVEPSWLCVSRHHLHADNPTLNQPVRILLLTDWHLGRRTRHKILRAKFNRLLRLHRHHPFDVLLLGGDYIDTNSRYLSHMVPLLEVLQQFGVPVLAVLGNHDHFSFSDGIKPLTDCLEAYGIVVLRSAAATVTTRGGDELQIIGLEDLQESAEYHDADRYRSPEQYKRAAQSLDWYAHFDDASPHLPRLLLAHNPDAVYLRGRTPAAVLSGHTHGGQIMLLDWVSRALHRVLHRHLPPGSAITWAGCRSVDGRTLIVSRGIDGASVPLRLMRSPEAVSVTLH